MMVTKVMRMIKMMLIKMMSTKILIIRDHLHVLEMLDMLEHSLYFMIDHKNKHV